VGWFGHKKRGTVTAQDATAIRVCEPDGRETVVDIATLEWLSFLQIGDETTAVHEGWWILGRRDAAIAIVLECAAIDPLLRDGPLTDAADRIPDKTLIFTAERPDSLRGRDAHDGIVHLDGTAALALRSAGSQERVRSVREFPRIV
jgi:hypothetical protein